MTENEAIQFLDNIKHAEAGRAIGKYEFYAELMGYHVEALNMAIKALETIPKYKDAYGKGWDDGAKATYEHLKMCEEEQAPEIDVLDKIRAEIEDIAFDWQEIDGEHESFMVVDLNDALQIIDKYKAESDNCN